MRQRQPHRPQLQQTRGARIEDTASDVDVRDGVAVKKDVTVSKINEEGNDRGERRQRRDPGDFRFPPKVRRVLHVRGLHSRWVSSRKTWKRASISSRVNSCRRSVPKRSTVNDPI